MATLTRGSLPTSAPLRLLLAPSLPATLLLPMSIAVFRMSHRTNVLGFRIDLAKSSRPLQNWTVEEKLVRLRHWSRMMTSIMFSRNMLQ